MSAAPQVTLPRSIAGAIAVALLLVGVGGGYLVFRNQPNADAGGPMAMSGESQRGPAAAPAAESSQSSAPAGGEAPLPDVVVTLAKDAVERAGIVVTPVAHEVLTAELRLPGAVEPNAYRQVSVTPLVGGRVLRVSAQLGDRVRPGQSLAQIYSPELADAQRQYVSARAMLDAHDRELQRTQKLVEIGAASRQELERIHAEHAAQTAAVESSRSRLELLGAAASGQHPADAAVDAAISVPAPFDGVVTERLANVGLNVDPATKLFTVVDLSSVWVIADVHERDLRGVREGERVRVTTAADPDRVVEGRIGYIDPQIATETRTAKVRVEVANPQGALRLGMYADVVITIEGSDAALAIPKSALQHVGSHQVVYLPQPSAPATFIERAVHLGRVSGNRVEVLSGLQPGDLVVTEGSFFLRAEAERLGLRGG